MSIDSDFRSDTEEVSKLLEEYAELRRTLKTISNQLSRMENRVKRAFPQEAKALAQKNALASDRELSISASQALQEFDRIVALARSGEDSEARRMIEQRSAADLLIIAKELGVAFKTSKPSVASMREAVFGKVRESLLMTQHHVRTN